MENYQNKFKQNNIKDNIAINRSKLDNFINNQIDNLNYINTFQEISKSIISHKNENIIFDKKSEIYDFLKNETDNQLFFNDSELSTFKVNEENIEIIDIKKFNDIIFSSLDLIQNEQKKIIINIKKNQVNLNYELVNFLKETFNLDNDFFNYSNNKEELKQKILNNSENFSNVKEFSKQNIDNTLFDIFNKNIFNIDFIKKIQNEQLDNKPLDDEEVLINLLVNDKHNISKENIYLAIELDILSHTDIKSNLNIGTQNLISFIKEKSNELKLNLSDKKYNSIKKDIFSYLEMVFEDINKHIDTIDFENEQKQLLKEEEAKLRKYLKSSYYLEKHGEISPIEVEEKVKEELTQIKNKFYKYKTNILSIKELINSEISKDNPIENINLLTMLSNKASYFIKNKEVNIDFQEILQEYSENQNNQILTYMSYELLENDKINTFNDLEKNFNVYNKIQNKLGNDKLPRQTQNNMIMDLSIGLQLLFKENENLAFNFIENEEEITNLLLEKIDIKSDSETTPLFKKNVVNNIKKSIKYLNDSDYLEETYPDIYLFQNKINQLNKIVEKIDIKSQNILKKYISEVNYKNFKNKDKLFNLIILLKDNKITNNILIDIKNIIGVDMDKEENKIIFYNNINNILKDEHTDKEEKYNVLTEEIFYKIGKDTDFINILKKISEEKVDDNYIHTNVAFEKAFFDFFDEEQRVQIQELFKKENITINTLIDNLNSINFQIYSNSNSNNEFYNFILKESNNLNFIKRYEEERLKNNNNNNNSNNNNDNAALFKTIEIFNPDLLTNSNVHSVKDLEKELSVNYTFSYFRNIVRNNVNRKTINSNKISDLKSLLNSLFQNNIVNNYINDNEDLDIGDNFYFKRIEVLYKIINNKNLLDPESKEIFEMIVDKKDLQSLLMNANINNFDDFKYFFIDSTNKNKNIDILSLKQEENMKIGEFKKYIDFYQQLIDANLKSNGALISKEEEEILDHAIKEIKKMNINIDKQELDNIFRGLLKNENLNLIDKFDYYNENIIYKNEEKEKFLNTFKQKIYFPKQQFGINNNFVKLTSFELKKPQLQLLKIEEELDNINIFEENALDKLVNIDNSGKLLVKESNYHFLIDNCNYILKRKNDEDFKKAFFASYPGNDEEAKKYFNENLVIIEKKLSKLEDIVHYPQDIEKIEQEILIFEQELESNNNADIDIEEKQKKSENIYQNIRELEIKKGNKFQEFSLFIKTDISVDFMKSLKQFQKFSFISNKLQNNIISSRPKNISQINKLIKENNNFILNLEELDIDTINFDDISLKIDKLYKNKLISFSDKENFLLNLKKKNIELCKDFIGKKKLNLMSKNKFFNELLLHLENDNYGTVTFVNTIQNDFDKNTILDSILSLNLNKKVREKIFILFDLTEELNDNKVEQEYKNEEEIGEKSKFNDLKEEIQGGRIGNNIHIGTSGELLFEKKYSEISSNFFDFIKKYPKFEKALKKNKIKNFKDTIELDNKKKISFDEIIHLFIINSFSKTYPSLSEKELEKILFKDTSNSFFITQMEKTVFLLKDSFKNEYMQQAKSEETEIIKSEIKNLNSLINTYFTKFEDLEVQIQKEKNELKILFKEKIKIQKAINAIKNMVKIEDGDNIEEILKEDDNYILLKKQLNDINFKISSTTSSIKNLEKDSTKVNKQLDQANSQINQKRKLLSNMNTSTENIEDFKHLTLAQRLFLFGDNNTYSEEEIKNMSPEQMKNIYIENKDDLPLSEIERKVMIEQRSEEEALARSIKDSFNQYKKNVKNKSPFVNSISSLNRDMEYLGYRDTSSYYFKVGAIGGASFVKGIASPILKHASDVAIRGMYPGKRTDADAFISKYSGYEFTSIGNIKSIANDIGQKIMLKKEREKLQNRKEEANKNLGKRLDDVLEFIKRSPDSNKTFINVLNGKVSGLVPGKHNVISDIMNPKNRAKFESLSSEQKQQLDNFREGMYKQLKRNLTYNINPTSQKQAVFKLLDTMKPSNRTIKALANNSFVDLSEKGFSSNSSEEYIKLIKIMRGNGKNSDPSYHLFVNYLKEYIGDKTKEETKEETKKVYKGVVDLKSKVDDISMDIKSMKNIKLNIISTKHSLLLNKILHDYEERKISIIELGIESKNIVKDMSEFLIIEIEKKLNETPNHPILIKLLQKVSSSKIDLIEFTQILEEAEAAFSMNDFLSNNDEEKNILKKEIETKSILLDEKKIDYVEKTKNKLSLIFIDEKIQNEKIKSLIILFMSEKPMNLNFDIHNIKNIKEIQEYINKSIQFLEKSGINQEEVNQFKMQFIEEIDLFKEIENSNTEINKLEKKYQGILIPKDSEPILLNDIEMMFLDKDFEETLQPLLQEIPMLPLKNILKKYKKFKINKKRSKAEMDNIDKEFFDITINKNNIHENNFEQSLKYFIDTIKTKSIKDSKKIILNEKEENYLNIYNSYFKQNVKEFLKNSGLSKQNVELFNNGILVAINNIKKGKFNYIKIFEELLKDLNKKLITQEEKGNRKITLENEEQEQKEEQKEEQTNRFLQEMLHREQKGTKNAKQYVTVIGTNILGGMGIGGKILSEAIKVTSKTVETIHSGVKKTTDKVSEIATKSVKIPKVKNHNKSRKSNNRNQLPKN